MEYGVNAMLLKFGVIQMRRIDCCNDVEMLIQNRSDAMMMLKQLLLKQLKSNQQKNFCFSLGSISHISFVHLCSLEPPRRMTILPCMVIIVM